MIPEATPAGVGDESPCYERRPAGRAFWLKPACILAASLILGGCFKRGVTPIRTHFNQGVYHYSVGDYRAAIGEYRQALEENAADHRARFNLAEALESRATRVEHDGDPDAAEALRREAEEHYRALLAADPHHLRANVNLAARELDRGDAAAAKSRLRAAIERHPRSALPRVALAAHRLREGEIREAATILEEAVARDHGHPDANVLLGHAYAALARDGESEPELVDKARAAYERALERVPGDVGALMGLARLERRAGNLDHAESLARRALYILPDLIEAHLLLADLLEPRGELEEATAQLWRARQLEADARPHLARDQYRQRLLDLYRRLAEQEGGAPDAAPDRAYLVLAGRSVQLEPPADGLYIAGELRGGAFVPAGEIRGNGKLGGDGHPGWLELVDLSFHGDETGRAPLVPHVRGVLGDDGIFRPASREVSY